MNTNKFLYEFCSEKQEMVDKTETSKDASGQEIKITKKELVVKPVRIRILKPTRKIFDEAELFYGVKLSEGIKSGLLTRSLLAKRYQNDGGALSEPEKQRYASLYLDLFKKETEFQRVQVNLDNLDTELHQKKTAEILNDLLDIKRELQEFELYQSNLFEQTAENRARNQTIMWWVLSLSYLEKEKDIFEPIFGSGNYEHKLSKYDEIEEGEDDFVKDVIKKLAYFISLWYVGRISNQEDFNYFNKVYSGEKDKVNVSSEEDKSKSEST
ncbi:MAG: hypothetical protein EBU90_08220 [Proteobacteria bacterium]|nr:hypothetical protein [Pseudomonadota bacterium]NBP14236.1 hypothetical protein [bacterium]